MNRLPLSRGNSRTDLSNGIDSFMSPMFDNENQILVDVLAIFYPKEENVLVPEVRALTKDNDSVDLSDLLNTLKFMDHPVGGCHISYFSHQSSQYIYCGKDPVPTSSVIPCDEIARISDRNQVIIQFRQDPSLPANPVPLSVQEEFSSKMEFEEDSTNLFNMYNSDDNVTEKTNCTDLAASASKHRRTKERMIGEILQIVVRWRQLYNGIRDPETGLVVKMNLEEAASKVGISKKSLDDYLLQIRFGTKYGFNFTEHMNDRVGVLRSFVKKNKSVVRSEKDSKALSTLPAEFADLLDKKESKSKPKKDPNFQPNIGLSTRSRKIANKKP